ncbi:cytidine deaminase [Dongia mobilis]|uniref:Cytidine deaminase n=1 Tax=Dongia mobilis TaxID=578943 RepID=A0A4V3DF20_9PROT|nr:cytidine deaminase [Dongia mobilis]TDQ84301.1 cytidine deaminase [Dongia mobilis]
MKSELFAAAKAAMDRAYAPYSHFPVGAAILAEDGRVYAGCNVENASFPEGWCAETSALGAMVTAGARRIRAVAVIGTAALTTPCGGCRQRLAEFAAADTPVHICGPEGVRQTFRLDELLPAAFDKEHLP